MSVAVEIDIGPYKHAVAVWAGQWAGGGSADRSDCGRPHRLSAAGRWMETLAEPGLGSRCDLQLSDPDNLGNGAVIRWYRARDL